MDPRVYSRQMLPFAECKVPDLRVLYKSDKGRRTASRVLPPRLTSKLKHEIIGQGWHRSHVLFPSPTNLLQFYPLQQLGLTLLSQACPPPQSHPVSTAPGLACRQGHTPVCLFTTAPSGWGHLNDLDPRADKVLVITVAIASLEEKD